MVSCGEIDKSAKTMALTGLFGSKKTLRSTSFRLGTLRFRRYAPHPRLTGIPMLIAIQKRLF